MVSTLNVLTLEHEVHVRQWLDGKTVRHPESHFLDIVIDGTPLRQRVPDASDLVTELNRAWLGHTNAAIEGLLGKEPHAQLDPGRFVILVCGACGDIECGALTVACRVSADTVTWSDWRWADSYGEHALESPLPTFVFARAAYTATLTEARARLAGMPHEELEHSGRRFLWPWQWGWRMPKS